MADAVTNKPEPIRLGIAGLGMAGAVMVQAAAAHRGYVLRAAADPHPVPRAAFARDFEAKVYDDVAGLCDDPDIEVIYIATPHQFHRPHAILAAEHGKHIILEKPMALTLADCDAIIAAVERANVNLIVGHTHSFDPQVHVMRLLISSGALGRLGMIHSFNYTNFLYRPRRPEELDTAQGGGILFNQIPHQIDTVRLLAGGLVRSVRAQTTALDRARPTEGSCAALLQFENGAAASLVYSGYDYLRFSDEWHFNISERGTPKTLDHGAARRALMQSCGRGSCPHRNFCLWLKLNRDAATSATFRYYYCDLRKGRTPRFGGRFDPIRPDGSYEDQYRARRLRYARPTAGARRNGPGASLGAASDS